MPTSFAVLFDAEFEQEEAERLERVRAKARTLLEEGRRRAEIEVRHVDDIDLPARRVAIHRDAYGSGGYGARTRLNARWLPRLRDSFSAGLRPVQFIARPAIS